MSENVYQQMYPEEEVLKTLLSLIEESIPRERKLYTSQLLCWLMINHFLLGIGSLRELVLQTFEEGTEKFVGDCKRKRQGKWSENTSALSQARMKLPLEYFELLLEKIHGLIEGRELTWRGRRLFSIDGTTLKLDPSERTARFYEPYSAKGKSAFPIMLVTVAHDLLSGIALSPEYAPMYGDQKSCEQEQTLSILPRLPANSIVVSDRAHGIFSIVHSSVQHGHDVVYRLTDTMAEFLLKSENLFQDTDQTIEWKPSARERKKYPEIPPEAAVQGRVIVQKLLRGKDVVRLVLFTTLLDVPAQEIIDLYGKRWQIEGDLRDLKKTLLLNRVSGKTVEAVDRQVLAAIIGYNIVRVTILLAAEANNIQDPRTVGFKNVVDVLRMKIPQLLAARSRKERNEIINWIFRFAVSVINKKRNRKSYPREVYERQTKYPSKIVNKNNAA
jgi:hypothetical protein